MTGQASGRLAALGTRLRETFLRPRSVTLLHLRAPTLEQLAALAPVIDDMSNPRSSLPGAKDMRSPMLTSEPRT